MRKLSDVIVNQNPLTLPESATVQEACRHMAQRCVGSVLVTDKTGALVGIFTGRDAVARVLAKGRSSNIELAEVMTTPPLTMAPEAKVIDSLRLMWDRDFRHVPVVKEGKIVGLVTRGDFQGIEQDNFDQERHLWEHMR